MTVTDIGTKKTRDGLPNITGVRAYRLIRDLAIGDVTAEVLADRYDMPIKSVYNFTVRNRERIAEVTRDIAEKITAPGLWVARKELRIASLQEEVDRNKKLIADMQEACESLSESMELPVSPDTDKIVRLQANIIKAQQSAAEELGQLQSRTSEIPTEVKLLHVVEGLGDSWGE